MRPEALMQWSVAHFQGASEFSISLVKRQGAKSNHVGYLSLFPSYLEPQATTLITKHPF